MLPLYSGPTFIGLAFTPPAPPPPWLLWEWKHFGVEVRREQWTTYLRRDGSVYWGVDRGDWALRPDRVTGLLPCWQIVVPLPLLVAALCLPPAVALLRAARCRGRKRREGCCVSCGYCLTGNVSGVCPECGTDLG